MAREYIEEGSTKYLKALVKMAPADTFSTGGIGILHTNTSNTLSQLKKLGF